MAPPPTSLKLAAVLANRLRVSPTEVCKPVTELPLEVQLALKPRPERQRDAAPAAPRRTDATQQRRRARHRLFHSQRALRHGVVMMTVLGPCRALKPYDQDI